MSTHDDGIGTVLDHLDQMVLRREEQIAQRRVKGLNPFTTDHIAHEIVAIEALIYEIRTLRRNLK